MLSKTNRCESCGLAFNKKQQYCARIELFANPQVELDEHDLKENTKDRIRLMIKKFESMDVKKLEEDVYICYDLLLCKKCRDIFSQRLKFKEFI